MVAASCKFLPVLSFYQVPTVASAMTFKARRGKVLSCRKEGQTVDILGVGAAYSLYGNSLCLRLYFRSSHRLYLKNRCKCVPIKPQLQKQAEESGRRLFILLALLQAFVAAQLKLTSV